MGINHLLTGMILQVGPLLWVISVYWATTFGSKIKTRAAFLRFFLQEDVAYPPKFNSEFAPEKFPAKFWKVVFKAPFFRGELLNFSGVDFRVAFVFALFFLAPSDCTKQNVTQVTCPQKKNKHIYIYLFISEKNQQSQIQHGGESDPQSSKKSDSQNQMDLNLNIQWLEKQSWDGNSLTKIC